MSDNPEMIDPKELIEFGDGLVTFKVRPAGERENDRIVKLGEQPRSFTHNNQPGQLRAIDSLEEACVEGQRAALFALKFYADNDN